MITADIAAGFSRKKQAHQTVLTVLDLTAAFDNVDHQQLLNCLQHQHTGNNLSLAPQLYAEQTSQSSFFSKKSKSRKVKTGVAQGGILYPALSNYNLADFPTPPLNIKLIKYADDITIYTSGPVVADLINGLNIYMSQVLNYFNNKKLTVSTAKFTVTLFMPDTHEYHLHPQVKLADLVLSLKKKPIVLGVTLDTHLISTQHCNNITVKVQQRNNVLKAVAGSTWGSDKETLLTTYQAIGRSILSYCCPVWTPLPNDTNWSRFRRAQKSVLRIATGSLKMADVAELHQEARELPVRQHNELISQQFAIACHLPQHPSQKLCHRVPDDRPDRRRSQISRLKPNIQQYLAEEPLSNTSYMSAISSIHQDVVRTAIESSSRKLLNCRPPPIATSEQTLPKKIRTMLAQLHTGYRRILSQYMKRINPTVRNHCHDRGHSPYDTHHLFDSLSKPTTLIVESLWTALTETAKHLNLAIDETS